MRASPTDEWAAAGFRKRGVRRRLQERGAPRKGEVGRKGDR